MRMKYKKENNNIKYLFCSSFTNILVRFEILNCTHNLNHSKFNLKRNIENS
jgi:hypothetical protein